MCGLGRLENGRAAPVVVVVDDDDDVDLSAAAAPPRIAAGPDTSGPTAPAATAGGHGSPRALPDIALTLRSASSTARRRPAAMMWCDPPADRRGMDGGRR
mmetsp:Transcript_9136/g.16468  ORF Transcript_9136/g.16468 Transcript_9136/m.16468 type:complete len:100 (+) Transcript_9136:2062-2361(+)